MHSYKLLDTNIDFHWSASFKSFVVVAFDLYASKPSFDKSFIETDPFEIFSIQRYSSKTTHRNTDILSMATQCIRFLFLRLNSTYAVVSLYFKTKTRYKSKSIRNHFCWHFKNPVHVHTIQNVVCN